MVLPLSLEVRIGARVEVEVGSSLRLHVEVI